MSKYVACEVCRVNPVTVKERRKFRKVDGADDLKMTEFLVCRRCARLNNFWFLRVLRSENKQKTLEEMLEGDWLEWVVHREKDQKEENA